MYLPKLIAAARTSSWKRFVLNQTLGWRIPFNHPHGYQVFPVAGGIRVRIPYWPVNRNHIKGIHACALATGAELCCGLSLMEHMDASQYRLIMASLHMEFHKQAKKTAFAQCLPDPVAIDAVKSALATEEKVNHVSTVELHDGDGTHLATGTITWQVKGWGSVKMKV